MKLYVMRHGPAEDRAESGADGDRALTPAGRERVRDVAQALVDADEQPLRILSSPLVRAVQTAEIVAMKTKLSERSGSLEVRRALSPECDALGLVRRLASSEAKRVMLVGHEPDLSSLVSSLLGGGFDRSFDKAMVVGLQLSPNDPIARLRFMLDPKSLQFESRERT